MKRVIHRIQALGDKAAQLKQVVEGAPAVASGIRDAVAVTASQLQQLRADVQAGVSGLRVEDEDRLLAALREVSASTGLFEQAGFVERSGCRTRVAPAHHRAFGQDRGGEHRPVTVAARLERRSIYGAGVAERVDQGGGNGGQVFQEFAPDVLAGVEAGDDRIHDARRAVHDVQRRMEPVIAHFARGDRGGSSSVTQPVSTAFMWMPSAW
jgi:hypothetical protein